MIYSIGLLNIVDPFFVIGTKVFQLQVQFAIGMHFDRYF
ncbi:hypothetical protein FM107_15075 [Sphingobacterium sp. JB170]|nr:hypothetical protein FM107_15075 [Sphingobacterium sp. JB170]